MNAGAGAAVKFDIVTIFPELVRGVLREGILARAIERGLVDVTVHDLRDFTTDRHRVVDDTPFGGGPGMVLNRPEERLRLEHIRETRGAPSAVILPTPQGQPFSHAAAVRLSRETHVVLLCGRYEGIDERVSALATEEISLGDYVLSGGELAALVVVDAVTRQIPDVVGDARSVSEDSFANAILDHPHYTRPAEYAGAHVPEVLLSGHHGEIARWRRRAALRRTWERRPDLIVRSELDAEQREWLREWGATEEEGEQES